jgi:hypothetical protein
MAYTPPVRYPNALEQADPEGALNTYVIDNLVDHETRIANVQQSIVRLAYQTRTSDFSVTTATVATATDVFSTDLTWTADGTSAYQVKFWAPGSYTADVLDRYLEFHLVNGSGTDLGIIGQVGTCQTTARRAYGAVNLEVLYTPAAGSASVNLRCLSVADGSGAIKAGPGGSGQLFPAYMAVYGPQLT